MNALNEIYQNILENPNDNAIRLVFADMLEEMGYEQRDQGMLDRARFIRADIAVSVENEFHPYQTNRGAGFKMTPTYWQWITSHAKYAWKTDVLGGPFTHTGMTTHGWGFEFVRGFPGHFVTPNMFVSNFVHVLRAHMKLYPIQFVESVLLEPRLTTHRQWYIRYGANDNNRLAHVRSPSVQRRLWDRMDGYHAIDGSWKIFYTKEDALLSVSNAVFTFVKDPNHAVS